MIDINVFRNGADSVKDVLRRNHVQVIGQGEKTIVLAHGFGSNQKMWQYITPALEHAYRIVLFDYVGSGNADIDAYDSDRYGTLHGYAQDLLDVIDALELTQFDFVGHSISGMIGLLAALEKPECFHKIVMIGASSRYLNDDGYVGGFEESDIAELLEMMEMNFTGWASYMAPLVMDASQGAEPVQALEHSFASTNPRIAREFAEVTFFSDNRSHLPHMNVPTLLIQCAEDSIVPLQAAQYLQAHLPNAEMEMMHAKGHYPHISKPAETLKLIQAFLA